MRRLRREVNRTRSFESGDTCGFGSSSREIGRRRPDKGRWAVDVSRGDYVSPAARAAASFHGRMGAGWGYCWVIL